MRQATNSIRDPSYRLDHFLTDMVDIFPELNLYYVYDPPADYAHEHFEAAALYEALRGRHPRAVRRVTSTSVRLARCLQSTG